MTEILKNLHFKSKLEVHLILTRLISLRNFVSELEFTVLIARWEELVQLNLMEPEHQMAMRFYQIESKDPHKND